MVDTDDKLTFDGEVVDFSNGKFKVKITDDYYVLATLSGKIRQNSVRILLSDKVSVEVSPYDTEKGRIIYRHKT